MVRMRSLVAHLFEQFQTFQSQPLKRIGAGARFVRAAAQNLCACRLHGAGSSENLIPVLHAARSRHDDAFRPADLDPLDVYNGIHAMKLAGGQFVGAADLHDVIHAGQGGKGDCKGFAHIGGNGARYADGDMLVTRQAQRLHFVKFDARDDFVYLLDRGVSVH